MTAKREFELEKVKNYIPTVPIKYGGGNLKEANGGFMLWYMRIGRVIYGGQVAVTFIVTIVLLFKRSSLLFIAVLTELALGVFGVITEAKLSLYKHLGTTYMETNNREERFNLVEFSANDGDYFVIESGDEYTVKLAGDTYFKSYRKRDVTLVENPNIDRPFVEITSSEKVSKPANNEYSAFALKDDRIKIEVQKIVVKSKADDIRRE